MFIYKNNGHSGLALKMPCCRSSACPAAGASKENRCSFSIFLGGCKQPNFSTFSQE